VLPGEKTDGDDASPDQLVVPSGAFGVEHAIGLWHEKSKRVRAVLTKHIDQGTGLRDLRIRRSWLTAVGRGSIGRRPDLRWPWRGVARETFR